MIFQVSEALCGNNRIAGERDPQQLAGLRHQRIKASAETIAASLEGTWREGHLFALEQALQRYDFLGQQIADCEARITEQIEHLTQPEDAADDDTPDDASHSALPGTAPNGSADRTRKWLWRCTG